MVHATPRRARTRTAALATAAVLALVPLTASCGEGDDASVGPQSPDLQTTSEAASPPASPTATATGSPTATGSAPADPQDAEEEIRENWTEFFDPKTSTDERVRLLENGDRLRPVIEAFGNDPNAAKTSARVKSVSFTSATGADVTYDVLVGGRPALPGSKGTAVLQQDTWKVSRNTLCALVKLSGNAAVPGC
ncbi:hypothetical protein [Streptomyces roseolilacinus]|nr:hypothetical protein [Streptomyces roseolilacinus]